MVYQEFYNLNLFIPNANSKVSLKKNCYTKVLLILDVYKLYIDIIFYGSSEHVALISRKLL